MPPKQKIAGQHETSCSVFLGDLKCSAVVVGARLRQWPLLHTVKSCYKVTKSCIIIRHLWKHKLDLHFKINKQFWQLKNTLIIHSCQCQGYQEGDGGMLGKPFHNRIWEENGGLQTIWWDPDQNRAWTRCVSSLHPSLRKASTVLHNESVLRAILFLYLCCILKNIHQAPRSCKKTFKYSTIEYKPSAAVLLSWAEHCCLLRVVDPLVKAIWDGDASLVRSMVKKPKVNLLQSNQYGWIPMHEAAYYGQVECLRAILGGK